MLVFDVTDPDSFRWATDGTSASVASTVCPADLKLGCIRGRLCTLKYDLMLTWVCFCRRVRDWVKELRQMVGPKSQHCTSA